MAILSANSRKNVSSSPPLVKSFDEDEKIEIFVDNLHETLNTNDNEDIINPNSTDSPVNNVIIHEHDNTDEHLPEINLNEQPEELITPDDLSLHEYSNGPDNAESPTLMEAQRSCTPDDCTRVDSSTYQIDECDSTASEYINYDASADFTTECCIPSHTEGSEDDTIVTDLDASIDEHLVTFQISPNTLSGMTAGEDNLSSFCSITNLQIDEPTTTTFIETEEIIFDKGTNNGIELTEATADDIKSKKLSNLSTDKSTRPNFIPLQDHTNPFESVPKPWCKTNLSTLGLLFHE